MAAALGFVINDAGSITPSHVTVPASIPEEPSDETWVSLVAGHTGELERGGGSIPSVALWDDDGNRIGRYKSHYHNKLEQGDFTTLKIKHGDDDGAGKDADPNYIMLSGEADAVCIAMVQVSNGRLSGIFYGDTAYQCGQSWYYSNVLIGHKPLASKCAWLDADHSNGINARAMSFHVNDMVATRDKMELYERDHHKYLCASTPRYAFWKRLLPEGEIPFFKPPLEYNRDSESGGMEGADKDPERAVDRIDQYDKDVYVRQGEPEKAYRRRRSNRPHADMERLGRKKRQQGSNVDPDHLVVTELYGQTAREICEHPSSVGYDIVSYVDNKFCDISERKLYDLCSSAVASNCFDANSTTIVGGVNARGEESGFATQKRSYKTRSHWK